MKDSIKQLKKDLKAELRVVKLIQSAINKLNGKKTRRSRKAVADGPANVKEPKIGRRRPSAKAEPLVVAA